MRPHTGRISLCELAANQFKSTGTVNTYKSVSLATTSVEGILAEACDFRFPGEKKRLGADDMASDAVCQTCISSLLQVTFGLPSDG